MHPYLALNGVIVILVKTVLPQLHPCQTGYIVACSRIKIQTQSTNQEIPPHLMQQLLWPLGLGNLPSGRDTNTIMALLHYMY